MFMPSGSFPETFPSSSAKHGTSTFPASRDVRTFCIDRTAFLHICSSVGPGMKMQPGKSFWFVE